MKRILLVLLIFFVIGGVFSADASQVHNAARSGELWKVESLIRKNPDQLNAKLKKARSITMLDMTPLHLAAFYGRTDVVDYLLAQGADFKAVTVSFDTPLHLAARGGRGEIVEMLLARRSETEVRNHEGLTPLHLAARDGNPETVKILLAKGASVNALGNNRDTPLHLAAYNRQGEKIARILISAGADVPWKNRQGMTPLHFASFCNRPDLVQVLIENGAWVNETDNSEKTAFYYAKKYRYNEVAALLEKFGGKSL